MKTYMNYLFPLILVCTGLQLIPLYGDLHLRGSKCEAALREVNSKIVAGFCLGFLSLILIDIVFDVFNKYYELLASRILLFFAALSFPILIVCFSDADNIGAVYFCSVACTSVICSGSAMVALIRYDATNTWTFPRVVFIIVVTAAACLVGCFSLVADPAPSSIPAIAFRVVFYALVFTGLVPVYLLTFQSARAILTKVETIGSLSEKIVRSSHQDLLLLVVSFIFVFFTTLYITLPGWINGFRAFSDRNTFFICSDMMLRLAYATSLVIFPNMLLKHKASALQRDLDMKQAFVRYVSHEVRTPLNIVLTGLELLKLRLSKIPDAEEPLELVSDCIMSTKTAVTILSDLLIYEKLESNLLVLEKTECHLLSFLVEHVRPFRLQADQKHIEMSIAPFRGTELTRRLEQVMVSIDATKIAQVLRNFVSNAVKFTPSGGRVSVFAELIEGNNGSRRSGINGRLSMIVRRSIGAVQVYAADSVACDSVVRVVVRDSGFGISAENQLKLFNEIVQFHANTQQGGGGSGIGLWISKQIVALHGGSIGVCSAGEGHGSEFFFDLPVIRLDANQEFIPRPVTGLVPGAAIPRVRALSIRPQVEVLIVDDSAMNRKLMGKLVAALGHAFVEADDGDTCVEAVRARMASDGGIIFHAILIDGSMPKMPGPEAIKQVRELGYKGQIVGVTGNGGAEDIAEFIDAGADSVLVKPVSLEQIQQIFRN